MQWYQVNIFNTENKLKISQYWAFALPYQLVGPLFQYVDLTFVLFSPWLAIYLCSDRRPNFYVQPLTWNSSLPGGWLYIEPKNVVRAYRSSRTWSYLNWLTSPWYPLFRPVIPQLTGCSYDPVIAMILHPLPSIHWYLDFLCF